MSQVRKTPAEAGDDLLERPLSARSLMASLLLGMHPPRLSSRRLVRWCALFGVSEGTARVALSRMVERGELAASDGVYELAGPVRGRQAPQEWALEAPLADWDGTWWLAAITSGERPAAERAAFRRAAAVCRLVEVREGLWTRPANVPRDSAPAEAWALVDEPCQWWRGRPDGDEAGLVERLFAPGRWATRGEVLVERLAAVTRDCGGAEPPLAEGLVAGAAALQHIRRDPLLPAGLLPASWPGRALRDAYQAYRAAYAAAVAAFFR